MVDRHELRQRCAPNAPRGTVRYRQVGVGSLDLLELAQEGVVGGVGDLRIGVDIVATGMVVDSPTKVDRTLFRFGSIHLSFPAREPTSDGLSRARTEDLRIRIACDTLISAMAPSNRSAGRLLVLIPAYNEEANLSGVIAGVRRAVPEADIVVIDDCSRDSTKEVACRCGAHVVRHPVNLGYGAALRTGYLFARRLGHRFLVQIDGDGQHDPAAIPSILAKLEEGADLVLGSRFGQGVRHYRAPVLRGIGMRLFGRAASLALGQRISDPTSGYQGLSRRLVVYHAEGDHFPQDYPDADMLILVGRAGFRICEVAVTMFEKPGGSSIHSGLSPLYYVLKMTLSILLILSGAPLASGKEER